MVSNVGDGWAEKFPHQWPQIKPPYVQPTEMEELRKKIQELKKPLKAAKKFDKATGQPDCEMDEKVKLIKAIAKLVGVDLGDVFGKPTTP